MKMKLIPKPVPDLAFGLILALAAMSVSADICPVLPGPRPDIWFDCWDCPYQCHGDADCQAESMGRYRVYATDVLIFQAAWKSAREWPVVYPDFAYNPCVDFDRDFDVDDCDGNILETWFGQRNVPPDCPGRPLELLPMNQNALIAGSTYTIEWTDVPSCCSSRYKLEYSTDNGESWLQMEPNEVSGTCSFDWIAPAVDSNQCLLRIEDAIPFMYDTGVVVIRDTTDDPFTIFQCPETLTGDLDEDCYVNFRDFNVLSLNWHVEPNFQTLAALAEQWCACGNPYDPACAY
ncbi:MAG: hypothetical protein JXN61_10000 [Sedimentisphaerales bacterium]|nr:hypothetical protein [Sedimentisphaerales bacterium]